MTAAGTHNQELTQVFVRVRVGVAGADGPAIWCYSCWRSRGANRERAQLVAGEWWGWRRASVYQMAVAPGTPDRRPRLLCSSRPCPQARP